MSAAGVSEAANDTRCAVCDGLLSIEETCVRKVKHGTFQWLHVACWIKRTLLKVKR